MRTTPIKISENGSLLVYESGFDTEFIERTITAERLNGLRIWTDLMTDPPTDLRFLSKLRFLEGLDVTSLIDYDFSFLKDLPNLRRLSINTIGKSKIDLSHQQELEYLALEWRKAKILGLEHCASLSTVVLIDYSETDLRPVSPLSSLRDLQIKTAAITTLDGLEKTRLLERLLIGDCRKLTSLTSINGLDRLKSLEIDACKKISDFDELTNLPNLEYFRLSDCGHIDSLAFTDDFPSLEELVINGNTSITGRRF
jgi:hypothetical protein